MGINWDFTHRPRRIAENYAQVIPTLRTGAVEVFGHGWVNSPSHPLGCQGEILEAMKEVTGRVTG